MSSSRRTRRRRQQQSLRRHQLRLEGLEKRYALNAAPVLDPSASPQLNSVIEDAGIPVGQVGTLVSDLIDTGGTHNNFSDVNGHLPGIAITGTNLQGGTLYYSTDDGTTWSDVGESSYHNYRLLHADSNTRLAFVPPDNFIGTIDDVITFKAWDRSGAMNGATSLQSNLHATDRSYGMKLSADGNTAYVADNNGSLQIIDVSNAFSPTLTGTVSTGEVAPLYEDMNAITLSNDGNTAYIAEGSNGLAIINLNTQAVTRISSPVDDTWSNPDGTRFYFSDLAIAPDGTTAYVVASGGDGGKLLFIDLTTETITAEIASDISPNSLTLSPGGDTAYLAGYGMIAVDLATQTKSNTIAGTNARDVIVSADGQTVYLAVQDRGLQIIDVSDPMNPSLTETINTRGNLVRISLSEDENTVYGSAGSLYTDGVTHGALQVIDLNTQFIEEIFVPINNPGNLVLSADEKIAYVTNPGDGQNPGDGLTIISLNHDLFSQATDTVSIEVAAGPNEAPIYPKLISPYPGLEPTREQGVDPVGPVGTLVSDMIDSDGQYKNFYDPDGDLPGIAITGCSSDVEGVWFSLDDGLTWTDAGVPTESSALLLHVDNLTRIFLKRNSNPIDPASSSATVGVGAKLWDRTGGFSSGQTGVDTTATGLAYFTGDPVAAVSLDGSFAVVGGDRVLSFSPYSGIRSIRIYDLSSPGSPTLLSEFELDVDLVNAVEISPDSRTVYVVGNSKVQAIDISNRSAPATLAIFANSSELNAFTHDIALSSDGSIAYVGVHNSRLDIFSVSQPSNPTLLGSFADTSHHGYSVALSPDGQYAYLGGRKLQIIDVSATNSPTLVLEMPLPPGNFFYPFDVEITGDGNTIFVAYINSYGESLVEIVDVSSPTNPIVQATIDAPSYFQEIVLSADSSTLYAPGSNFRPTYVFDVSDPSNPWLARSINHAFDWLSSDEQFLYSERGDYGAVETFFARAYENVGSELPFSVQTRGFSSPVVRAPLIEGFTFPNGSIWDGHPVTVTANGHFIDADATVTLSGTGTILNSHSVEIFHNFDHLELSVTHTVASSYTEQIVTIENPDGQTHSLSYSVGQVNYATDNLSVITGNISGILNEQGNALGRIQWSDNEGHSLDRVAVSSHGDHGRVSILSLGSNQWAWSYVPKSSFVDSDTFRLRFTDDLGYLTDQTFTVQGSVNLEPIEWSMVINQNVVGSEALYTIAAMDVFGQRISGGVTQITATSSDDSLIQNPSTIYTETNVPSSLSFTPVADANGTATLTIQVEDGGPDNNFATTEDNRQATHQVEVTVLEIVSNSGSAILAKDSSDSLYVNTQPVIYNEQHVPQAFFGSSVVSADTSDSENALLLQPLGTDAKEPTHRLLTDETWRINGIFNSLQNASSPVLDLSGREVSGTLNIAAVAGAYEINGVNNPTLIVRRGQTYTFNLNTAGHPLYLQTTGGGYQSANVYSNGFTGNSQTTGEHQWVVPQDAPEEIFYQCKFHSVMFGKIIVVD